MLSFHLSNNGPPSTGGIQQLAYNTNHKQGATKLLTFVLVNGDCWVQRKLFTISDNGPLFESVRFEM